MIGISRIIKPPFGTSLDWTNALTHGLQGFYALNEGGGNRTYDATGSLNLATVGSPVWSAGNGWAMKCVGANFGITACLPPDLRCAWPITWAIGVRFLASPVANNEHLGGVLFSPARALIGVGMPTGRLIAVRSRSNGTWLGATLAHLPGTLHPRTPILCSHLNTINLDSSFMQTESRNTAAPR